MISGVIVKITSDTPLSTHDRIRARFDEYGNVAYVDVTPGSDTGYVRFSNQSGAQKAIEMEGGSVNLVCNEMDVPSLILRSISDTADGDASENFDEFAKTAAQKSANFVINLVERI